LKITDLLKYQAYATDRAIRGISICNLTKADFQSADGSVSLREEIAKEAKGVFYAPYIPIYGGEENLLTEERKKEKTRELLSIEAVGADISFEEIVRIREAMERACEVPPAYLGLGEEK